MAGREMESKRRKLNEDICGYLLFDTLQMHGHTETKGKLPSRIRVNLALTSFHNLLKAQWALDQGVSVAGCYIRTEDLRTNTVDYPLKNARLLLSQPIKNGTFTIEAQCFCQESDAFFTSITEVPSQWFDQIQTKIEKTVFGSELIPVTKNQIR